jgi:predicted N-formylglutamate amidohydrolase
MGCAIQLFANMIRRYVHSCRLPTNRYEHDHRSTENMNSYFQCRLLSNAYIEINNDLCIDWERIFSWLTRVMCIGTHVSKHVRLPTIRTTSNYYQYEGQQWHADRQEIISDNARVIK